MTHSLRLLILRRVGATKRAVLPYLILPLIAALSASAAAGPPADAFVPNEIIVKFRSPAADALEQQHPTGKVNWSKSLQRLGAEYKVKHVEPLCKNFREYRRRIKQLQSKPKSLLSSNERRLLRRLNRAPRSVPTPDLGGIYKIRLELPPDQSLEQALEAYQKDPDVEYAEFNYVVSICATPNDPLFTIQWPLQNTGQMYPESGRYNHPPGTPDADIDAELAWDINTGSTEIIVAVVDTGVDYTHRDLAANMWTDPNGLHGYDFLHDDNDPMDDHGHGTHCAGIIAAKGNNQLDITGVCWNARIMALKFLNSNGNGDAADAAEAVYYAVENGADIISNSWGTFPGYPKTLKQAFEYAYSQGVISVAAAGNLPLELVQYPALFETVIAVAATDSRDEKATFSSYGEYVDIAAPGVDVLSLRAQGTAAGTVYDNYTTIMSGTSMACPHIAGAFALILSHYPDLDMLTAVDIIMDTTDRIEPEVCKSGRLNAYKAMLAVAEFYAGFISLNDQVYSCSDTIRVLMSDLNLAGTGTHPITISASGGDFETMLLQEHSSGGGAFIGTIDTEFGEPNLEDGRLQLSHLQIITAAYEDENDGTGQPATVTDTAYADCKPPAVYNVAIDVPGPEPTITFETNEPTRAYVFVGLACGGPYVMERSNLSFATAHQINLKGLSPYTDYFLWIKVSDVAENETIEDNHGRCYDFTTTGPADIYVPAQYLTIQEAIYRAWNGSAVWVADGIYTGPGNTDVDFLGRAVTVQSENGPQDCIIDCRGTETDPHYAFYFHNREEADSVLAGFTITNGYVTNNTHGGAITCLESNPLIANCNILACRANYGGAISSRRSSPTISACTITANTAVYGGGISCEANSPVITSCLITGNHAIRGGGLSLVQGDPAVISSTICGNRADMGGGIYCLRTTETIINSILWGNLAPSAPQLRTITNPTYSCIQDWQAGGHGNILADPCLADIGYWDANGTPDDANDDYWVQGDYHLRPGSPCIDAGDPNYPDDPNQTDIDDEPRVFAARIDIGADEFVPVTEVPLKFTPRSFNPTSKGKWVKAHMVLPEGFAVDDVDTNTPAVLSFLGISVQSQYVNAFINEDGLVKLEIAFDHSVFCHAGSAQGTVKVTGLFTDGSYFRGADTIKIVDNTFEHLAVLAYYWLQPDCANPDWCGGLDLDRDGAVNFADFATFDTCCAEILAE
jgi:subtilisin family serine protease